MEEVGVEAVVKGLTSFLDDMKSMDEGVNTFGKSTNLLGGIFTSVGNIVSGLIGGVFRTLEYTLGNLLSSAIQTVIQNIKDLIGETISAGAEFQTLELRLRNLNFNDAIQSGKDFNTAMQDATQTTKDQLTWLQKLAVQTPYDATDISNVFTLGRSYGYTADQAKGLTEDITNFAAGMGLGNEEIERIIVNFGQMSQQANVNQRDLNDLARGSFVPVNDILKIMQEQTGLTGGAFEDFQHSAKGVNAFMKAFSTLVKDRFANSADTMARTFQGATDNVKDFVKSLVGMNIVKPVLDVVGGKIADFISLLTNDSNWNQFTNIANKIGQSLSDIATNILGLGGNPQNIVDGLLKGFQKFSVWLDAHKQDIVDWVKSGAEWIQNTLIPAIGKVVDWVQNTLVPAFDTISAWVSENGDTIRNFFSALLDIISTVFSDLTGGKLSEGQDGLKGFLDTLTNIMQFVIENKDAVAKWVEAILKAVAAFIIFQAVLSTIIGIVVKLAGTFLSFLTTLLLFGPQIVAIAAGIESFIAAGSLVVPILLAIVANLKLAGAAFSIWLAEATAAFSSLRIGFSLLVDNVRTTVQNMIAAFQKGDWVGVGISIVKGMINGIGIMVGTLAATAANAAYSALQAAKRVLGIRSPSAAMFDVGENLMKGFANGIADTADMATKAMQGAVDQLMMPAMNTPQLAYKAATSMSTTNTYQNTNNFNATFVSNTPTEPLMQDFGMMQSLVGG